MKKIILSIVTVALLSSLWGCKKLIEPEIRTEINLNDFGNTPDEANLLLAQSYSMLRDRFITGSVFFQRFTTDYNVPAPGTSLAQSAIAKLNYNPSDGEVYSIWTNHYTAISRPNLVIEKALANKATPGLSKVDSLSWAKIEGEARFLRAFSYFNLVRLFRNVPIIDKFFTSFAEIDNVSNLPASQMKEQENKVYDFIISDFKRASELLPETPERGRAGKYAALAFLAKTYLTKASITKYREATGPATDDYQKALDALMPIVASNKYDLKDYYPDNFIREKQYTGKNEFLFTLEYAELDGSGERFGEGSGFVGNGGGNAEFGSSNGANGAWYASDFGWSVFDMSSPGDIVRRFWTFERADFVSLETNGISGLQNSTADCPNGINCEVFLRTEEPYQYTRPYWFEVINSTNSFRYSPVAADVATAPNGRTYFTNIWGGASTTNTPQVYFVKYRRAPVTQPNFSSSTFDADIPIMRYAEVLLMYAEVANELFGPSSVPTGGTLTAVAAVNKVRNRARNFVYYPSLTVNSRIIENSPYSRTYGDIFKRVAKVGTNPATTDNAADTLSKYYNEISAFRGIREVPAAPTIRNFKDFPATANYVPDFPVSLSQTEFRQNLLDERWRELAGEQNLRWYDLTRFGTYISRIQMVKSAINPLTNRDLTGTPFGQQVLPEANPKFTYFPIPQAEINRNSNLNQNSGF